LVSNNPYLFLMLDKLENALSGTGFSNIATVTWVPLTCALDCNGNDVPDECELESNDCNNNEIPDDCDPDGDGNGIPDECDGGSQP